MTQRTSWFKIVAHNFRTGIFWKMFFLAMLVISIIGWKIATDYQSEINNLGDFYFIFFAGPDNFSLSLLLLLIWFIPQMFFYYLIGNMAYGELSQHGYVLLPRIGSRKKWWSGKVAGLFLISMVYLIAVIVGSTIGACMSLSTEIISLNQPVTITNIWPGSQTFTGFQLVWVIVLLYISSYWALGTLQLATSLIFKKSADSFLLVSMLLLFSCIASIDQAGLVRWLPGTQTILARHSFIDTTIPDFSLGWSLLYNLILFIISFLVGNWVMKRLDITRALPSQ